MSGEGDRKAPLTVLIVEDEALVALGLSIALGLAGYRVIGPAGSLKTALALGAERRPEIALVDLHLHGRPDGIAAARALAASYGTTIIFLTAVPEEAQKARDCAFGVIAKPYDLALIPSAIEAARQHRDGLPIGMTPRILERFR